MLMSLLAVSFDGENPVRSIIAILLIGIVLGLIQRYAPIDQFFKNLIFLVVGLAFFVWFWNIFVGGISL